MPNANLHPIHSEIALTGVRLKPRIAVSLGLRQTGDLYRLELWFVLNGSTTVAFTEQFKISELLPGRGQNGSPKAIPGYVAALAKIASVAIKRVDDNRIEFSLTVSGNHITRTCTAREMEPILSVA